MLIIFPVTCCGLKFATTYMHLHAVTCIKNFWNSSQQLCLQNGTGKERIEICIFHFPVSIQLGFPPCALTWMSLLLGGGSEMGNTFLEFGTLTLSELRRLLWHHHLHEDASSELSTSKHRLFPSNPQKSKQAFLWPSQVLLTSIHLNAHQSFPGCNHFYDVIYNVKECQPIPNCLLNFTSHFFNDVLE